MTADDLARAAGVDLKAVAHCYPFPRYRLTDEQARRRIAVIRAAVRRGGLNSYNAQHLAKLLKCDPIIFLRGWDHAQQWFQARGTQGP